MRHDPVPRDVLLVFSGIAVQFLFGVSRMLMPATAAAFNTLASALLLAQPFLTLRLASRLRRIPRWLLALALLGWAVSTALLVPYGAKLPPAGILVVIGVFVVTELVAAGYFIVDATR